MGDKAGGLDSVHQELEFSCFKDAVGLVIFSRSASAGNNFYAKLSKMGNIIVKAAAFGLQAILSESGNQVAYG